MGARGEPDLQRVGPKEAPMEIQGCVSCHRAFHSEPKIPYVRLERLKICAASSGEMPVFKLKPQKSDQDGSFLLVIECGTESSSMSIKVPLPQSSSLSLFWVPAGILLWGEPGPLEGGCSMARLYPLLPGACEVHIRRKLSMQLGALRVGAQGLSTPTLPLSVPSFSAVFCLSDALLPPGQPGQPA